MKILFDLRCAQVLSKRGIGRYIEGLIEGLILHKDIELSFLISKKADYPNFIKKYKQITSTYVQEIFDCYDIKEFFDFYIVGSSFLLDWIDEKQSKIDIVFPKNIMQFCNKKILILHDLITLDYAGTFLTRFVDKLNFLRYFETLQYFDHFFTNSLFTKTDALRFMPNSSKDFTPIFGGVSDSLKILQNYEPKKRTNNIVDISGDHVGKNYINLSIAFAKAYTSGKIPQNAKLYLICKCGETYINNVKKAIETYGLSLGKEVIVTNYIPDDELKKIVSTSRALVHPAYIEGLGLPVLESYAMGTPAFGSNITAVREFVHPEASFDPTDNDSITAKIIQLYNDDDLCIKAYKFGFDLLKIRNWHTAADTLVAKLKKLNCKKIKKKQKYAIFLAGSGACAETAIQIFSEQAKIFDIFVDVSNFKQLDYLRSLHKNAPTIVFPIESFDDACIYNDYLAKIFEVGSSGHHKRIFDLACSSKGEENRYLILPDATAVWGFYHMFHNNMSFLCDAINKWYPELTDKVSLRQEELLTWLEKHKIMLTKMLINMTGIHNLIVYSKKNKDYLISELTKKELSQINLLTLDIPVKKITAKPLREYIDKDYYIVGTFGTPDESTKRLNSIVEAIGLLIDQNIKIKLIVAGNGVKNAINKKQEFIIIEESPDYNKFLSIMSSIDVGIQLRENSLANSSGCLAELLGLGKKVITTEGIMDCKSKNVFFIKENSSVFQIANIIKEALYSSKIDSNFEYASFFSTASLIKKFINKTNKGMINEN